MRHRLPKLPKEVTDRLEATRDHIVDAMMGVEDTEGLAAGMQALTELVGLENAIRSAVYHAHVRGAELREDETQEAAS